MKDFIIVPKMDISKLPTDETELRRFLKPLSMDEMLQITIQLKELWGKQMKTDGGAPKKRGRPSKSPEEKAAAKAAAKAEKDAIKAAAKAEKDAVKAAEKAAAKAEKAAAKAAKEKIK